MNTLLRRFQSIKKITLYGKRWWPRHEKNWVSKSSLRCYSSVEIYINDCLVNKINNHLGYGNDYQMIALDWLQDNNYITREGSKGLQIWKPGRIEYIAKIKEVKRKKDL